MKIELITREELQKVEDKLEQMIQLIQSAEIGHNKIYITQELAEKLQVSTKTIQNWREQRLIEYSQISNKIYYTDKSVQDFLATHSIKRFTSRKF